MQWNRQTTEKFTINQEIDRYAVSFLFYWTNTQGAAFWLRIYCLGLVQAARSALISPNFITGFFSQEFLQLSHLLACVDKQHDPCDLSKETFVIMTNNSGIVDLDKVMQGRSWKRRVLSSLVCLAWLGAGRSLLTRSKNNSGLWKLIVYSRTIITQHETMEWIVQSWLATLLSSPRF